MIRPELQKKIDQAIKLLRQIPLADGECVEVSYSCGKDSDVILQLTKEAGIPYRAIYKNTTIDPPGTINHAKEMGAEILQPKESFFQLIKRKGFPTRRARFCCSELKEYKVLDKAIQGIRTSESAARAKRYQEPQICRFYGSKKNHVQVFLPILSWTDEDVAEFVADRQIKCHALYYDDGVFNPKHRLGCMGCPMASDNGLREFVKHPKLVKAWIRAGQEYLDTHPHVGAHKKFNNAYEMFVHNVFFHTYEEFRLATRGGLFESEIPDCKEFLENYFKIKL